MGFSSTLFILLSLLGPVAVVSSHVSKEKAVISGNVTLSSIACEGQRTWELKKDAVHHLVIDCNLGNCDVGPRFQNRVHLLDNKLIINPVLFGDEDWYIYYCNTKDVLRVHLSLQSHRRSATINSSGNITISQCSREQVKVNFIQIGSSTAETAFIVDDGRVFGDSQASRGMTLSVQNGATVLSNLVHGGMFIVMASKSGKILCEVNCTLIESDQVPKKDLPVYKSECLWSPPCWLTCASISYIFIITALVIYSYCPLRWKASSHHQTHTEMQVGDQMYGKSLMDTQESVT